MLRLPQVSEEKEQPKSPDLQGTEESPKRALRGCQILLKKRGLLRPTRLRKGKLKRREEGMGLPHAP
jgi:hypothetical protein